MTAYDVAAKLPLIDVLRDRCKALAVLECVVDSGEPRYAYTTAWGDHEAAFMDNGSGDAWTIVFTADGAFIRVFDHESAMTPYRGADPELWPGLLDGLPEVFRNVVADAAFADEEGQLLATAVLWRRVADDRWHAGEGIDFPPSRGRYDVDPDGSGTLEILLDDVTDRYVEYAEDYYEMTVDRTAVEHVVRLRPLTDAVVRALNPDRDVVGLRDDLEAIGYPPA